MQSNVTLALYEYQWPAKIEDLNLVKKAKSDSTGHFDFGTVRRGHYTLAIDTPWNGRDIYDVEVVAASSKTASITIDISPNFPDCTHGHEFIVHQR